MAEGLGFTVVSYPTDGVDAFGAAPPMATAVSEPVASISTYTGIRESMPRCYADDYHRRATGVTMTVIPGYVAHKTGYTMPAPGFTSLSGGRSSGSGRSSNKSRTLSETQELFEEPLRTYWLI